MYLDFWKALLPMALIRPYGGEGEMDAVTFGSLKDLCVALDIAVADIDSLFPAMVA